MKLKDPVADQSTHGPANAVIEFVRSVFGLARRQQTPTVDLADLPLTKPLTKEEIAARQRNRRVAEISE